MYDDGDSPEAQRGWVEFQLAGPLPALEVFADFMSDLGAGGAVFSESPDIPGAQMVTAFLPFSRYSRGVLARIKARAYTLEQEFKGEWGALRVTEVEDRDWAGEWKKQLKPERIEPGVWIIPLSCEQVPETGSEPVIRLDPGLAFGTGGHATTRMCIEEVGKAVGAGARSVLDLGTGTGIIAMAAARLGAERILAMDIDVLALRVARENLELNGLLDRIELAEGVADPELRLDHEPFDVIAANLFAEVLVRLMPFIARHLAASGTAVISGIMASRREMVEKAVAQAGLETLQVMREDEWLTILAGHSKSGK